jgi:TRAP-type C4-dicarboxylate transport system permease large subunit
VNVHLMLPTTIALVADVGADIVVTTVVLAVNLSLGLGT